jgi:hypothetical protein
MNRLPLLIVFLLCSLPAGVMAQQRTAQASVDALQPAARLQVVRADTLLAFRTRAVPGGRLDVDDGVLRAAYQVSRAAVSPSAPAVANARAVLAALASDFGWNPSADEPTGNLDSVNGNEVMQILSSLHDDGTSILMVTHSAENASFSQRTIRMLDGKVIGQDQQVQ